MYLLEKTDDLSYLKRTHYLCVKLKKKVVKVVFGHLKKTI